MCLEQYIIPMRMTYLFTTPGFHRNLYVREMLNTWNTAYLWPRTLHDWWWWFYNRSSMLSSTAQSLRLRVRFVHTSWTRHPTTHYASMLPPALALTMQYKYSSRYHHSSPHLNIGWYEIWQMLNSQLPISLDPLLSVSVSGICASHITFPWSPDRVTYVADFTESWLHKHLFIFCP